MATCSQGRSVPGVRATGRLTFRFMVLVQRRSWLFCLTASDPHRGERPSRGSATEPALETRRRTSPSAINEAGTAVTLLAAPAESLYSKR
jgi:hypothetical protein